MTASALARWLSKRHLKVQKQRPRGRRHPDSATPPSRRAAGELARPSAHPPVRPFRHGIGDGRKVSTEIVRKAPRGCRHRWVICWGFLCGFVVCFVGFFLFAGRTAIRRKEGWHPGREKAPSPGGARRHAGSPAPMGVLASQVLRFALPRADRTEQVPRRRKAPDVSNSDVQRATLAIHSLGLVCVFFLFLYIF